MTFVFYSLFHHAGNPGAKCSTNNKEVKGERKEEYLLPCLSESKNPKWKEMGKENWAEEGQKKEEEKEEREPSEDK